VALLLVLTLRFSGTVSSFSPAAQRFTLLAPVAETPVLPPRTRTPRPERYISPPPALSPALPAPPARLDPPPEPTIPAPAIEVPKSTLVEIPKSPVTLATIKASGFTDAKTATPEPAPKPVVKVSGFQSAESSPTGPARGTSTVTARVGAFDSASSASVPVRNATALGRSGGFSDASASGASATRHLGSVTNGTFGDSTVDKGARQTAPRKAAAAAFTPVEILSKPKPAYTDDARSKKIEGEVLLEMRFSASGEALLLRVVRGLGHGLDEAALAAAQGIRFRPATRDGVAVDSAAIVHIVFQLAE